MGLGEKFLTSENKIYNTRSHGKLIFVLQDVFEDGIKFVKKDNSACSFHAHVDSEAATACCVLAPVCSCMSTPHHCISGFHRSHNRSVGRITLSLFVTNVTDFFVTMYLKDISRTCPPFGLFLSLLASSRLSVLPHGTTRFPLDGFW